MSSFVASWPATVRRGGNRLAAWLRAWLSAYVPWLVERRPTVQIDLGPWLPGWALRLAMGMLALGCAGPFVRSPLVSTVIIGLVIAVTLRPSGVGPSTVLIVIAVLAAAGPAPAAGETLRTGLLVWDCMPWLSSVSWSVGPPGPPVSKSRPCWVPLPRSSPSRPWSSHWPCSAVGCRAALSARHVGDPGDPRSLVVTYVWLPRLGEPSQRRWKRSSYSRWATRSISS